jgi:penicillin amidase
MRVLPKICILMLPLATVCFAAVDQQPEALKIKGLEHPVEILHDRWGVAHIYAQNEHDLFFAQGYNIASERLFQLEMWRRQATGTVSEVLGRREIRRDLANRLFQFRGDIEKELAWYHPHGAAIVTAFVNGINAFVEETKHNPALLQIEFRMLGIKPGEWTPAIVVSRFAAPSGNLDTELSTALTIRALNGSGAGVKAMKDLEHYQPGDPNLEMDKSIDPAQLSKNVIELYDALKAPFRFVPEELGVEYRPAAGAPPSITTIAADLSQRREDIGSNNWVIAGKLTASGFPLVASDPHPAIETPSPRYIVHLNAPGWDVIGASEPGLPGVSIGHNDFGAWGLTTFGTDTEDLYVYDTNPTNPLQYRYNGGWETMSVVSEAIVVKGEAQSVPVDLKYTRHGAVVFEDTEHHKAYAVRAAWREIGSAPYLASLRIDQAHSWEEFQGAAMYFRMPAENMVWGDRAGNIGYQVSGISPQRSNWSGLVPVPGDGRYEWNGFLDARDLPHVLNPDKGFVNTSNDYQIPSNWPYKDALHYTWADPYRADASAEFIRSGRQFTVSDMVQLQNNDLSIPARTLVPLLRDLPFTAPPTASLRDKLMHWDYTLDKDSVPAGIYEMFQRRLLSNLRDLIVPKEAQVSMANLPFSRVVALLRAPDGRFGTDPIAGRDKILTTSFEEAVAELKKRLGPTTDRWKLGAIHHATIQHPFSAALKADQKDRFDVGNLPRGGDSYTVTATGGADNQTIGGSFKIVADTENWDNSVGLNAPGQSGDVNSPHYRDLYPLWARGMYFPVFFSREKIDTVTEKTTHMEPPK